MGKEIYCNWYEDKEQDLKEKFVTSKEIEDKWLKFLDEEFTDFISDKSDYLYEQEKDRRLEEENENKN